jgi:hypothetical protein
MLEETLGASLASHSYTQDQAYFPSELETKHDVDYCLPSLAALGLSLDSQLHTNDGPFHSIHLQGFCPHYAAMLD